MSNDRCMTMKYLADVAGVSPGLVRRYVAQLRSIVAATDQDLSGVVGAVTDYGED